MRKTFHVVATSSLVIITGFFGLLVWWQHWQLQQTKVVFLNVGQGDAILLEQGSFQILIDGGKDGKRLVTELGRQMPFWDRTVEIIIPTHPDADHIAGFATLATYYRVQQVLWTGVESDTDFYTQFKKVVTSVVPEDRWHRAGAGSTIKLPRGGELRFLYPFEVKRGSVLDQDTNATSIVARFDYGETSFLFTGDLPYEESVLKNIAPVTVLKAAHHGSRFSTSSTFLGMTKPEEVIISVGKNTYGHPSKEVLERVEKMGAKIRRTDEEGSVVYDCTIGEKKKCEHRRGR